MKGNDGQVEYNDIGRGGEGKQDKVCRKGNGRKWGVLGKGRR